MPELPEVETIKKGIAPHVTGKTIEGVVVRERRLRWPIPSSLEHNMTNHIVKDVRRRAKYLLFYMDNGCMILHLGMSGSLCILSQDAPLIKHEHVDFILPKNTVLRFRDPRRFGAILWTNTDPIEHKLLHDLGPEPLCSKFNADYLLKISRKRRTPIKNFIMNSQVVAGVGNIYANEALFLAGINPQKNSGDISINNSLKIVKSIKKVLKSAIAKGGTTLRDFINSKGQPGYFKNELQVYSREKKPCLKCGCLIKKIQLGQRASYYCPNCQKN